MSNKYLFAKQRVDILFMKSMNPGFMPDSYAYAWLKGVYPLYQDGDYSVPDRPHESLSEHFLVSKEFVDQVMSHLDKLWLNNESPTFYELEDTFGGRDKRSELISICRYAYLDGRFDGMLWDALLRKMEHPIEAVTIISDFELSELTII